MEKRYDFLQIEKQIQEKWERENTYLFNKDADGEIFSIDTPPPTVNGKLHIGHLFSYTQAEMIARFRRMQGYNVFYPFGFDDNGLPTERLVERELGISIGELPRGEFIEKCKSITEKYENDFKELWKSLGFSVDWSVEYKTINPEICKISQKLFLDLVEKKKIYTKDSPVLWCTNCRTSIAQAELDTADIESTFIYIPFMVGETALNVATTRPELLYGCVCLFVNPNDDRYKEFIGKTAIVPLYGLEIPILTDEKVDINKGTGVVMCATFGDSTDAEWYTQYNLPYREVILQNGIIADDVPFLAGLKVHAARKEIIRLLDEAGLIIKTQNIIHAVGIHERCGSETEIIPSKQWYIDILTEKDKFLKAADEITWYPEQMKNRYIAWVENLKWDWCISRQRYFGVPFPVWYCINCGAPVFAEINEFPVDPLKSGYDGKCCCGCTEFIPEKAVFDTWATSSVTPQINERFGLKLTPMSMRTHAHDIIRTWTFYTIVRSLYHTGKIPWKELMICGFVLAKKGEKIGKSKNNTNLDPKYLIETHSADVLRYWTAGARLGTDTFFSPDDLPISKRFITKLWNAAKFSISHLEDFDFEQTGTQNKAEASGIDIKAKSCHIPIDKWIIERTNETVLKTEKLLYEYEIGAARHEIDELFWKDFCDNYIEIVKERLYEPKIHGEAERQSAQAALYYTLLNILKLYSIYVPHITEYIYQEFFKRHEKCESIHRTLWVKPKNIDNDIIEFGEKVKEVIFEMRKYKSERNLSMRTEMDKLSVKTESRFFEWFKQTEKDLKACSNANFIEFIIE